MSKLYSKLAKTTGQILYKTIDAKYELDKTRDLAHFVLSQTTVISNSISQDEDASESAGFSYNYPI